MKIKNLFITLGLAVAATAAVGAGLKASSVKEVKADENVTLYYDVSNISWWATGADTYAYCFKSDTEHNASWPGQKMSLVSGESYLYSLSIDSSYTKVIFVRTSTSNNQQVFNRSSKDGGVAIDLPTNWHNNNLWVATVDASSYDDGNYGGYWTMYSETINNAAYLRGDWTNGWTMDGQKAMTTVTSGSQYRIENVALDAGGTVKAVEFKSHIMGWCEFNNVSSTNSSEFPVSLVSGNATVTNGGVYTIVITKNGNNWDYSFTGSLPAEFTAAVDFCDDFEESMAKYCPVLGSETNKGKDKLAEEWSDFADRYNNASFADSRQYLTDNNPSDATFIEFQERYDSILADYYSILSSYNFLSRTVTPKGANNPVSNILANNNSTMIIVVISALVLVSTGGFFFLRKKQENE